MTDEQCLAQLVAKVPKKKELLDTLMFRLRTLKYSFWQDVFDDDAVARMSARLKESLKMQYDRRVVVLKGSRTTLGAVQAFAMDRSLSLAAAFIGLCLEGNVLDKPTSRRLSRALGEEPPAFLSGAPPQDFVFRSEGSLRVIRFNGEFHTLKEIGGFGRLELLLSRPYVDISALQLTECKEEILEHEEYVPQEKHDGQSLRALRQRLQETYADRDRAVANNDSADKTRCDKEIEEIAKEVRSNGTLPNGKRRCFPSGGAPTHARQAAQKSVQRALRSLQAAGFNKLLHHLKQYVVIGDMCSYRPPSPAPPWILK